MGRPTAKVPSIYPDGMKKVMDWLAAASEDYEPPGMKSVEVALEQEIPDHSRAYAVDEPVRILYHEVSVHMTFKVPVD